MPEKASTKTHMMKPIQLMMNGYENNKATVAQMQQYADCVMRTHPHQIRSHEDIIYLKMMVFALFIGAIIGTLYEWKTKRWSDGPASAVFMGGGRGMAIAFLFFIFGFAAYTGLNFLFS